MGRKERIEIDNKERKTRRLIKSMDRMIRFKSFIDRQKFLTLSTVFMFILVFGFTCVTFIIFMQIGSEPSTLVEGFFDFVKWEFAGLSLVKVSENIGKGKNDKIKEIVEDGTNIINDASDLINDVSNINESDDNIDAG